MHLQRVLLLTSLPSSFLADSDLTLLLVNFVLAVQSDAQLLICFSPIWNISDIKIEANTQGGGKI